MWIVLSPNFITYAMTPLWNPCLCTMTDESLFDLPRKFKQNPLLQQWSELHWLYMLCIQQGMHKVVRIQVICKI